MRRAMADAEVGDDVFGDDPTVIALEERAAELTGKEAALFVSSGTMGNLVSLMAQVPRGGEIIAGEGNHTFAHEAANFAVIVGATHEELLPWDDRGRMDLARIRLSFRDPLDVHDPITSLVTLENTHSDSMAQPLPADYVATSAGSRTTTASRCTWTVRASSTRPWRFETPVRDLLAAADSATLLPLEGPRLPGRLRCCRLARVRSGAHGGRARWSVAACARSASWPRPA